MTSPTRPSVQPRCGRGGHSSFSASQVIRFGDGRPRRARRPHGTVRLAAGRYRRGADTEGKAGRTLSDLWAEPPVEGEPAVGAAAEGRVRVVLEPSGRVREVILADGVGSMTVPQLSAALVVAFQEAQDAVRVHTAYAGLPSAERLAAVSAEATAVAERRFAEISTALYALNRRVRSEQ